MAPANLVPAMIRLKNIGVNMVTDTGLYDAVKDCGKEIYLAGDAKEAGQALQAVAAMAL